MEQNGTTATHWWTAIEERVLAVVFLMVAVPFLLFFLVSPLVLPVLLISQVQDALASREWPSTSGRIIRSEVFVDDEGATALVTYEYSVNGVSYGQSRIGSGNYGDARPSRSVERYPKDKEVLVYYNPEDPGSALLEPGIDVYALTGLFLMGAIVAGVGLGIWYFIIALIIEEANTRRHAAN